MKLYLCHKVDFHIIAFFQKEDELEEEIDIEDIISRIPPVEDVLYKKRQHLPGYPLYVVAYSKFTYIKFSVFVRCDLMLKFESLNVLHICVFIRSDLISKP